MGICTRSGGDSDGLEEPVTMMNFGRIAGIVACAAALLLLAVAAISGSVRASGTPTVSGAWIRLPVVAGRPAAAYATIRGGDSADRLIAVEAPAPARAELHMSRVQGGVMRMTPLTAVAVAANAEVVMQPGGMHVMLFAMAGTTPGSRVPLIFVFEKAGRISVPADARAADADAGAHHH